MREGTMQFIHEQGFDIREGEEHAYQQWLAENEAALAAACPEGVEYLGTFYALFSDSRTAGTYRMLLRYDSYGALDRMAAEMAGNTALARLVHEGVAFMDMSNHRNGSNQLFKLVTDSTILTPEA
jgi:hypothetical protein